MANAMRRPVEIEFACNINDDRTGDFCLPQIRPIVNTKQELVEDVAATPDADCLLKTANSLGHGISEDVADVVYVRWDDNFSAANNPQVAIDIEKINRSFLDNGKHYILIGRTMGQQRPLARRAGEVARHQCGARHCRGGVAGL